MNEVKTCTIKKAFGVINRINEMLLIPSFLMFFGCIVWGVITRFILKISNSATEDLSRTAFVWACSLAAAPVYYHGRHIRFLFLIDRLPEKVQSLVQIFCDIVMLILAVFLVTFGWKFTMQTWNTWMVGAGISKGWLTLAVPVSGGFLLIQSIGMICSETVKFVKGGNS